jgi:hypothetical protein
MTKKCKKMYIKKMTFYVLTFFTNSVRIPFVSYKANTERSVSFDLTFSLDTARMRLAWILTFFTNTCKMLRTFRIRRAFRPWS